jgi:hypothetical protein
MKGVWEDVEEVGRRRWRRGEHYRALRGLH